MKIDNELRDLNDKLITKLEQVEKECKYWKVKASQLEGVIDELTAEIDVLKEHLGQESDSQLKEQNRLLRQVLKGVL